ncbi:hypothetical protein GGI07_002189 [Coemansia sp. Benny D115]|nr:hypothetical protein GGI07_002189 [Coemansia sp. Benny D115]
MDASEIELYATRLAEVEVALLSDPDNTELLTLKSEISDLLALVGAAEQTPTRGSKSETKAETKAETKTKAKTETLDAKRKDGGKTHGGRVGKKTGGRVDAAASGQQAWLQFAHGKNKKRLKAKAINDQSIFKSPTAVQGRVGVVNSGRGMTKAPSGRRNEHGNEKAKREGDKLD